jgi:hypothetical protein
MAAKILQTKLVELANRNAVLRPLWSAWRRARAVARSPFDNIYHCCTQKTASQWFRGIFADPAFTDYTGLEEFPYVSDGLRTARFDAPFPPRTVATHLYVDYRTYLAITKPSRYRTFFVLRDPRDIVTSWYFSALYSHAGVGTIPEKRTQLAQLDLRAGLKLVVDQIDALGLFEAQHSWLDAAGDPMVAVFRYEELAADNHAFLRKLLDYLEVPMPAGRIAALSRRHSFERHANGRAQGLEDAHSHYRKGVAGDWKNFFDDEVLAHFNSVAGDTTRRLGYAD